MSVTLRFGLIKGAQLPELRFTDAGRASPLTKAGAGGYYATTAHGPDLFKNAQTAVRYMIDHVAKKYKMSRAAGLLPVRRGRGVEEISEIVDAPNWIVSAYLPARDLQAVGDAEARFTASTGSRVTRARNRAGASRLTRCPTSGRTTFCAPRMSRSSRSAMPRMSSTSRVPTTTSVGAFNLAQPVDGWRRRHHVGPQRLQPDVLVADGEAAQRRGPRWIAHRRGHVGMLQPQGGGLGGVAGFYGGDQARPAAESGVHAQPSRPGPASTSRSTRDG